MMQPIVTSVLAALLHVHDREDRHGHPYHKHEKEKGVADVPGGIGDQANDERAQEGARLDPFVSSSTDRREKGERNVPCP